MDDDIRVEDVSMSAKCVVAENGPKGKCELSLGGAITGKFMGSWGTKLYIKRI